MQNILVIKLGALGDIIQSFGIVRAIARKWPKSKITVMTRPAFAALWRANPAVSAVVASNGLDGAALHALGHTDGVFDLQNNDRTGTLAALNTIAFQRPWYGTTRFSKTRVTAPDGIKHAFESDSYIALAAGCDVPAPDPMEWMCADVARFNLPAPYALIIAGCSPQHPHKRWPAENYITVCHALLGHGITPVLIGTDAESDVTAAIAAAVPHARNLTGETTVFDLPVLAHGARLAIGNDTGPMHMVGPTGCPSLALFGPTSDPIKHRPLGPQVHVLRGMPISAITTSMVLEKLAESILDR